MEIEVSGVGIGFLFLWLLTSASGWTIGFAFGCNFGPVIGGLALGASVVGLQSVVLGRFLQVKSDKVLAGIMIGGVGTIVGGLLGGPLDTVLGVSLGSISFGSIHGVSVATANWIIFRNNIRNGWVWIMIGAFSGFVGMATGFAVSCSASLLAGALGGTVYGSITATALLLILKINTNNGPPIS